MGVGVYFVCAYCDNKELTGPFFKSPFPELSTPPSIGTELIVPSSEGKGCLRATVRSVKSDRALAETGISLEDMRDFLKDWKETSSWLD